MNSSPVRHVSRMFHGGRCRMPTCSVDECSAPSFARGWCRSHYNRWYRCERVSAAPCAVVGCDRSVLARGWCRMHYGRWQANGDPLVSRAPVAPERRITREGYVMVRRPGHQLANCHGYVLEHRLVVFEAGIPISPGHVVHHINHDKQDNRIENLEVLTPSEHTRRHNAEKNRGRAA